MATDSDHAVPVPSHIGGYRILSVLGEGGMGTVYAAEQDNPRRTVALKVVRPDLTQSSLLRRFELEAQVLGLLQHPGIAQIYEAGTADNGRGPQLFFAMELVTGQNLMEYAESRGLGTRERLELMTKVCDAVHHAHQKGVIHRDLKPDNILVNEEGQPKVLDFGVARSTNADVETATLRTDVGQLMGTVPYMSPEQVTGDPDQLDVRSDVYALGVVAYELLVGRLPYDLSRKMIHEAVRIIRDDDPTPLSSVNKLLRGDVETIVQKALEKSPDRRYGSATELGADISRYLDDEPIAARPPTPIYQLRKLAQRHRGLVGGIVAVFVVLVVGTIVSVTQAVRASAAEGLATQRADVAERNEREALVQMEQSDAVRTFLQEMLQSANPLEGNAPDLTVRQMLDATAALVERDALVEQPEAEAAVRMVVGSTYKSLGAYGRAVRHLDQALALFREAHGDDHPDVAECRFWLASLKLARGEFAAADAELAASAEVLRATFGDEHLRVARHLQLLSRVRYNQERLAEAEDLLRRSLEMRRRLQGDDHFDVGGGMVLLGFLLRFRGDLDGAEKELRGALAIMKRHVGEAHPRFASVQTQLADVLADKGSEGAEDALREALDRLRRFFADDHPRVSDLQWRLGNLLSQRRRHAEAEPLLREALEARRVVLGAHRDTATSLASLGMVLMAMGRTEAADQLLEEALAMRRELYGDEGLAVASSLTDLADLRVRQRRNAEAESRLREALVIWEGAENSDLIGHYRSLQTLGMLLQRRQDYEGAERAFRKQLEMRRRLYGDDDPRVAESRNVLASLLYRKGDKAAAEAGWNQALAGFRQAGLGESAKVLDPLSNLAFAAGARGDFAVAEGLLRKAAGISAQRQVQGFYSPFRTAGRLASNLGQQDKAVEYEAAAREALRLGALELPAGHWELAHQRRKVGHALVKQARYVDAEKLLLDSHGVLASVEGVPGVAVDEAVAALVELYEGWGKADEAARWRAKKK